MPIPYLFFSRLKMKIYLINLDRAPARLQRMATILSEMGLEFERIAAVDGEKLSEDELNKRVKVINNVLPISLGDIGCTLSHIECLRLIANGADEYAAVLEDDVHLSSDAKFFLSSDAWIPDNSDIVKLETYGQITLIGKEMDINIVGRRLAPLLGTHLGTGLYVISRRAAIELLANTIKINTAIDVMLFDASRGHLKKLRAYQLTPAVAAQDTLVGTGGAEYLKSTIEDGRLNIRLKPKGLQKFQREFIRFFFNGGKMLFFFVKPIRLWYLTKVKSCRFGTIPFKL